MTVRLRDCAPVPHDLVHVDQALNVDVAQWIGHGPMLHDCVSALCGHTLPPNSAGVLVRERDCVPSLHVTVHTDQVFHKPSTQLTGQAKLLQERASAACGHALPPNVG